MLGSSVILIIPRVCLENSEQGTNIRNEIGRSVFRKPQRQMTHGKQQEH